MTRSEAFNATTTIINFWLINSILGVVGIVLKCLKFLQLLAFKPSISCSFIESLIYIKIKESYINLEESFIVFIFNLELVGLKLFQLSHIVERITLSDCKSFQENKSLEN